MAGLTFTEDAARRTARAVKRVERMHPDTGIPSSDGGAYTPFPAPIISVILIDGERNAGAYMSGDGGGSVANDPTCPDLRLYDATSMTWNGCEYEEADAVLAFELNGRALIIGDLYDARVIDTNYKPENDDDAMTLCQVSVPIFGFDPTTTSGGSDPCAGGIPYRICNDDGSQEDGCLHGMGLTVTNSSGEIVFGGE